MFETREIKEKDLIRSVTASIQTDVGCVREANEDNGRHVIPGDEDILKRRGTLTIVADGMGGHASGEVASQMAVELINEIYYSDMEKPPRDALEAAIKLANAYIFETSISDERYYGMGTTVVALVILEDSAFAAHVGDSRLYHKNGRKLERLTIDHSQVMELVKEGIISLDEADDHEDKNVILRALGTQAEVEVEVSEAIPVNLHDEFLLCSDGLCDMLSDDEIRKIWFEAKDIHSACLNLISGAKQRGGHDNVTVGIVRVAPETRQNNPRGIKMTREMKGLEQ